MVRRIITVIIVRGEHDEDKYTHTQNHKYEHADDDDGHDDENDDDVDDDDDENDDGRRTQS